MMTNTLTLLEEYLATYPDPSSITDLSELSTEQSNPKTRALSEWAHHTPIKALQAIIEVEQDAILAFLTHKSEMQKIIRFVKIAAQKAERIFLVGCGASGRLVMLIERFVRDLRKESSLLQVIAVPAGGDIALCNAISQCEDNPEIAMIELELLGYHPGDPVIGFSANGAATFVLAALQHALIQQGPALLISCNTPSQIIHRTNTLNKITLFKTGIPNNLSIASLALPPPALSGSTRMHPTTIMLLAALPLLALFDPQYQDYRVCAKNLIQSLSSLPLQVLSQLCQFEQHCYENGHYMMYQVCDDDAPFAGLTALSIFTDVAERNPTFNLPPLGSLPTLKKNQASLCWIEVSNVTTSLAFWSTLLHRPPQSLHLKGLLETTESYLLSCDFSQAASRARIDTLGPHETISWSLKNNILHIQFQNHRSDIPLETNSFIQQLLIKVILNACSTTIFAKSRCHGNWMTHLAPTNLKLLQRMERILQILAAEHEPQISFTLVRERFVHSLRDMLQSAD